MPWPAGDRVPVCAPFSIKSRAAEVSSPNKAMFSAWPVKHRLQLQRSWKYHGRRYKLRPGTYKWFVWPGSGPLSAGKYGKLLGGSTFTFGGSD